MTDYSEIILSDFRESLRHINLVNILMRDAWKRTTERGIEERTVRFKFMMNYFLSRLSVRPYENFEHSIYEGSVFVDISDIVYKNTIHIKGKPDNKEKPITINILYLKNSGFQSSVTNRERFEGITVVIQQNQFALSYNYDPRFRMSVMVAQLIMFLTEESTSMPEERILKFLSRILMIYHPYTYNHSVANLGSVN